MPSTGSWSEYWWWEDAATPKQWLYRHFTSRRNDLDWSIDRVCFAATVTDPARGVGDLDGDRHALFPEFPDEVGPAGLAGVGTGLHLALHPGADRLEMRVRDNASVLGAVSFLEVEK